MGNRKEEILIVALHLFARDGYEAVSVSQIAGELDMTKGALYRHYKSKRDIFDSIVKRMEQQDGEQASDYDMPVSYTHLAVLALGGTGGTSLVTPCMRLLPLGVPKIMVSTMASGDVSRYVGTSDILMMPSIVDRCV